MTLFGGAVLFSRGVFACAERAADDAVVGEDPLVTCRPPVIGNNHGHRLAVPPADIAAKATKSYAIQGTSGHDHTVTITGAQFALLATGGTVVVTSSDTFGHTHEVTVSCAVTAADGGDAGGGEGGDAGGDAGGDDARADASEGGKDAAPQACPNGASATTISSNHGHALEVPRADVLAGVAKEYSAQGTSGHDHVVSLTSAHFAALAAGQSVTVESDGEFHTHTVTVSCV